MVAKFIWKYFINCLSEISFVCSTFYPSKITSFLFIEISNLCLIYMSSLDKYFIICGKYFYVSYILTDKLVEIMVLSEINVWTYPLFGFI